MTTAGRLRIVALAAIASWAMSAISAAAEEYAAVVADESAERSTTAIHLSKLATTGPKPAPITPPKPEEISTAIGRGVQFLLDDQRPDGSWGSPERTKGLNIYAPPPGAP